MTQILHASHYYLHRRGKSPRVLFHQKIHKAISKWHVAHWHRSSKPDGMRLSSRFIFGDDRKIFLNLSCKRLPFFNISKAYADICGHGMTRYVKQHTVCVFHIPELLLRSGITQQQCHWIIARFLSCYRWAQVLTSVTKRPNRSWWRHVTRKMYSWL